MTATRRKGRALMYHFTRSVALPLVAALLCAMPFEDARAQPDKGAKVQLDLGKIKADLESGNAQRMLGALEQVSAAGKEGVPAAQLVEALLRRGANPPVLERALQVAGVLGQESSSEAVAPYMRHRAPQLRQAATDALTRTGGPKAIAALRGGLHARDPEVRSISARGLGELGAQEAVEDLMRALHHDVKEASAAIGKLCTAEQCTKFTELLGKRPLESLLDGLEQILLRPSTEVADTVKLGLVEKLANLRSPRVGEFLASVSKQWPKHGSKKVKRAVDEAAESLGAGKAKP